MSHPYNALSAIAEKPQKFQQGPTKATYVADWHMNGKEVKLVPVKQNDKKGPMSQFAKENVVAEPMQPRLLNAKEPERTGAEHYF
ncbi:MAG: hypothetical protein WC861_00130 [Candidatus Micrarchaeia archaeon]|jgi:hypothetical protein